ncbi:luciferin 4-monooxygenase-like [Ischnura elegans]|uniref:luciferin 4-monooxygenase-like n=1 Tax=Ischnura elegans TaxID=197161 RepID=UPI001ED89F42|nr:luciferin 4-monooxygenase-like [Ischnura elegans]XP_046395155.1 luciferin 4-monooxygenase-like [Ischnura elegans]
MEKRMGPGDDTILTSPFQSISKKAPDVSITEFLFQSLEMNYELLKDQIWVQDIWDGASYKYKDIKPLTRKIASGLARLGFKKGDVLCFATGNVTLIYLVQLSVWIGGGAVRGFHKGDKKEDYEREMREVSCRFTLCDKDTCSKMKWASQQLGWDVQAVSIGGDVEDAKAIEDMIANDDGSRYPHNVKINPGEDVYIIVSTSGSTGVPKGVLHTHRNMVTSFSNFGAPIKIEEPRVLGRSLLATVGNHLISAYGGIVGSIVYGFSLMSSSKFDLKLLPEQIAKYKPDTVFMYPYAANIFIQSHELANHDLSSVKNLLCGGSVVAAATAKMFADKLPKVHLMVLYAMSEILYFSFSSVDRSAKPKSERMISGLVIGTDGGRERVSCGQILPSYEAKIVDPVRRCGVGRNMKGQLWVRGPCLMKGYLNTKAEKGYITKLEEDGWFDTGDIGYFDESGNLFIVDRSSFTFMYKDKLVSPSDIEDIIMRHPAVSIAGVIGVPNTITKTSARAYIVLKSNHRVTEEEMKKFVAERAEEHMQLHGGVVFMAELPESRGGKINRPELHKMSMREMNTA